MPWKVAHEGRDSTLNEIKSWGYYIPSPNSQTRKMGGKGVGGGQNKNDRTSSKKNN